MINISNKENLFRVLENLKPEAQPVFGIMSPQHMIEHLAYVIGYSNGKRSLALMKSPETAVRWKQGLIYTDYEMQPGVRAPFLGENELPELKHSGLEEAVIELKKELEEFEEYFKENPESELMHPSLGLLNYKEWIIFHSKHFRHHFRQFNLI